MTRTPLRRLAPLGAAGLLLALGACSHKPTAPDAGFTTPEGRANAALMVGWQDEPQFVSVLGDTGTPADHTDDILLRTEALVFDTLGAARMMILDNTQANGFQPFRSEANGGLRPLFDFAVQPSLKYTSSHLDLFDFDDRSPLGPPSTYIARGVFNGQAGTNSPLTNTVAPFGAIASSLPLGVNPVQRDSVLSLLWGADPQAAFYTVDVMRADLFEVGLDQALESSFPSPILDDPTIRQTLVIVPASGAGQTFRFAFYPATFPVDVLVRVFAYDAQARLINRLPGDLEYFQTAVDAAGIKNEFLAVNLGGRVIRLDPYPKSPAAAPAALGGPAGLRGVPLPGAATGPVLGRRAFLARWAPMARFRSPAASPPAPRPLSGPGLSTAAVRALVSGRR